MTMGIMSTGGKEGNGSFSVVQPKSSYCHVDSDFRYILFTLYYSFVFSLGIVANIYVLYIFIWVYGAKKRNEIKIYIINLTIADFLFLVMLPMWILYYHKSGNWIISEVLCNVASYLFSVTTYCSVAFLGVIAYHQFQAVTRPNIDNPSTRRRGINISVAIWLLIAIPAIYYFCEPRTTLENVSGQFFLRCFERYNIESDTRSVFTVHVVIFICFFATFLLVLVCDALLIHSFISKTAQNRESALIRQKALWLVSTILAMFIICFVPYHIIDLPWTLMALGRLKHMRCPVQNLVNDFHQVTLCLMSTNCVLDPIIICFLTKKFRRN